MEATLSPLRRGHFWEVPKPGRRVGRTERGDLLGGGGSYRGGAVRGTKIALVEEETPDPTNLSPMEPPAP